MDFHQSRKHWVASGLRLAIADTRSVGGPGSDIMNIKKKLLNPFALGAQGFVAGAILFWATHAPEPAQSTTAAAPTSVVHQIAGI